MPTSKRTTQIARYLGSLNWVQIIAGLVHFLGSSVQARNLAARPEYPGHLGAGNNQETSGFTPQNAPDAVNPFISYSFEAPLVVEAPLLLGAAQAKPSSKPLARNKKTTPPLSTEKAKQHYDILTSHDWLNRMHSPDVLKRYLSFVEENLDILASTPHTRFKVIRDVTEISVSKNIPVSFVELRNLIAKFEPYIFIDTKDDAERNYVVNKWMQLQFFQHPWPTAIGRIHAYAKEHLEIFQTSIEWMLLAYLIEDNSPLRFTLPAETQPLDDSNKSSLLIYQHVASLYNSNPAKFFNRFEDCYRDLEASLNTLINIILHYQKNIGKIEPPLVMDKAMQTRLRHQVAMSYLISNFTEYFASFNLKLGLKEYLRFFNRAFEIFESINFFQVVSGKEISVKTLYKILEVGIVYSENISNQMISRLADNIQKLSPSLYYAVMFSVMEESNEFNRRVLVELHSRPQVSLIQLHADIKIMAELKQYPALLVYVERKLLTQDFEMDVAEESSYFLLEAYSYTFEAMFAEKGMEVTLRAIIDFYKKYHFLTRSKDKTTPYIVMLVENILNFAYLNEGFQELRTLLSENWQVSKLMDLKGNLPYAELDIANRKVGEYIKKADAKTNRSIPVLTESTNIIDSKWLYMLWLFCFALAAYGIYGTGKSLNKQKTDKNTDEEINDKTEKEKPEVTNKNSHSNLKGKDPAILKQSKKPSQEKPVLSEAEIREKEKTQAAMEKLQAQEQEKLKMQQARMLAAENERRAEAQLKIEAERLEQERRKLEKKEKERETSKKNKEQRLQLEKLQQDRVERDVLLKDSFQESAVIKNVANKIFGQKIIGALTRGNLEFAIERFFALEYDYLLESSMQMGTKELRAVDSFAIWAKDEFLAWWEKPANQALIAFPIRTPLPPQPARPAVVRAPAAQAARPAVVRVPAAQAARPAAVRAAAPQPAGPAVVRAPVTQSVVVQGRALHPEEKFFDELQSRIQHLYDVLTLFNDTLGKKIDEPIETGGSSSASSTHTNQEDYRYLILRASQRIMTLSIINIFQFVKDFQLLYPHKNVINKFVDYHSLRIIRNGLAHQRTLEGNVQELGLDIDPDLIACVNQLLALKDVNMHMHEGEMQINAPAINLTASAIYERYHRRYNAKEYDESIPQKSHILDTYAFMEVYKSILDKKDVLPDSMKNFIFDSLLAELAYFGEMCNRAGLTQKGDALTKVRNSYFKNKFVFADTFDRALEECLNLLPAIIHDLESTLNSGPSFQKAPIVLN